MLAGGDKFKLINLYSQEGFMTVPGDMFPQSLIMSLYQLDVFLTRDMYFLRRFLLQLYLYNFMVANDISEKNRY